MNVKKVKPALIWKAWNREHIKKHKVTVTEVEEVYAGIIYLRQSYKGRVMIFGKTIKSRYIVFTVSYEKQKEPFVVSARDMKRKERREYDLETKTN